MSSIEAPEQLDDDGSWSLWRDALGRLYKNKPAAFSALVLCLMVLAALITPWIAPYDYEVQTLDLGATPPSATTTRPPRRIAACRATSPDGACVSAPARLPEPPQVWPLTSHLT